MVGQKDPSSLKSVRHILQWWNLAQLYLTLSRSKKYKNHVTHTLRSADISIFHQKSATFVISRNSDRDCILIHNSNFFKCLLVLKAFFNKHERNFDNTSKLESNYIVDIVMWPKYGNSIISMREVAINSIW